jgi:hypothetical protein
VLADFGAPDVVLNQFSTAGYFGYRDRKRQLPRIAKEKLTRLVSNHEWLDARLTVPFASFVHFCVEDNAYLNQYMNRPTQVDAHMKEHGCRCYFMRFGETIAVGTWELPDAARNLATYEEEIAAAETRIDPSPLVELDKIRQAYDKFFAAIDANFPQALRRWWLGTLTFHVPDLKLAIRVGAAKSSFEVLPPDPEGADVVVNSQPLWFGFAFPFGFETLGNSGRYTVNRFHRWQAWKRLSILLNLEVGLKLDLLMRPANRTFLRERVTSGLIRQLVGKQVRRTVMQLS